MGNQQATVAMDIETTDPSDDDAGHVHVLRMDADMQLLDALLYFYERLPRQRAAFLEALAGALRTLQRVFPIEDVAVETSTDAARRPLGVRWRWSDAAPAAVERWTLGQALAELPASGAWLAVRAHRAHRPGDSAGRHVLRTS
jgi:hypothetical protein